MKCPFCGEDDSKVVNSRSGRDGAFIRRRRECLYCHKRFTTREKIENIPLFVIKKDGRREEFDREKIIKGILRACEKRDIPYSRIEEIVSNIEKSLYNEMSREIAAKKIGDMVMKRLQELDEVAYIRFASVYKEFREVSEFSKEVRALLNK
ncbi:MAG: transcriptional regulator NrdR [Candidatus Sumerlaeota bacterium]|jgi:transcriptional repressor NrdR|nr:transcriptional regulator NrdR [Candidatus Sumerlaeota bacterium]